MERLPEAGSGEPIAVGDRVERRVRIDAASVRRFATEAGDHNPLHHDETLARRSRFGGLIASGAQSAALLTGCAATFISGRAESVGLGFAFEFRRAVPAENEVVLSWRVAALGEKPGLDGRIASLEGELRLEDGTVAVRATGSALIMGPAGG